MSSQALQESMSRHVAERSEQIASEARADAERIVNEARRQAAELREHTTKAVNAELENARQRSEQKAQAEASRAALAMKNDAVEAVMAAAEERIRAIVAGSDFPAILDALLAELMAVATGDIVVLAPAAHVDHVKQWLAGHDHASVPVDTSPAVWDGVAVQDPKRTYRISNTLTSRYTQTEQEARKICMTSLFDE